MTGEATNRVSIRLEKNFEFSVNFDAFDGVPPLLVDEPPPLGGSRGPNPSALLAAAVGNCLAASLAFCLQKARVELTGLEAVATARIARNDAGRLRIAGIDVELSPAIAGDPERMARCLQLFEDFCIVTASVKQGIPIGVTVRPPAVSG